MVIDKFTETVMRRTAAAVVVVTTLTSLAGCAGAAPGIQGDYPDLTLAETKSPAQLMRKEAADRLPASVIDEKIESEDVSVACLSITDDPGGLIRSWHSSIDVTILDDTDVDVAGLVNDLSDSFTEEGWVARPLGGSATVTSKLLESAGASQTDIQITGHKPDPNRASTSLEEIVEQVTVKIQVHGPCVRTDGPDSAEVVALEK